MKACLRGLLAALIFWLVVPQMYAQDAAFDVLIVHGHVIDGTGSPWYSADLGIRNGRIVAIGKLDGHAAVKRIDAGGRVVAPGFIDMLGQSELTMLVEPREVRAAISSSALPARRPAVMCACKMEKEEEGVDPG